MATLMCGIAGYVGNGAAIPVLLDLLSRLAYRGYGSVGIGVSKEGRLYVEKAVGEINALRCRLDGSRAEWCVGIGHTRSVTHGEPSMASAHPHVDCGRRVALVHNGIVENCAPLKARLEQAGHQFRSQTDTEVLVHLIEEHRDGDLLTAVQRALRTVNGSLALVVLDSSEEDRLVAARMGAPPLIIAPTEGGNYIASDSSALLRYTNRMYTLDDGEAAVITRDSVQFTSLRKAGRSSLTTEKSASLIDRSPDRAERGGYPHFMLKEIHEQPRAIRDTLSGRLQANGQVQLEETGLLPRLVSNIERLTFVACGTSFHAGLVAKYLFQSMLRVPVEVAVASEFRYGSPVLSKKEMVVAISQSGETADTIGSAVEAQMQGAPVLAITNVVGSTLTRNADFTLYTRAGPEIAVASTKTFTTQLVAIYLLALYFRQCRRASFTKPWKELAVGLRELPQQVEAILDLQEPIRELAEEVAAADACFVIGRNLDEAIAREGALKLKEIAYIHAHAYPAGELKHGTLALMDAKYPVIESLTQGAVREKTLSNVHEVLARNAPVAALVQADGTALDGHAFATLRIPKTNDWLAPVLAVVTLQLLAYYCGVIRGCEVDTPRDLAKSVAVE